MSGLFSPKQKRSFQRITSGLKFAKFGNQIIRFLTLTSSNVFANSVSNEYGSNNKDFQVLRKRILRYSPYRLYKEDYITHNQMVRKYGRNNLKKKFSFEYFKVETSEGNGVLHILYRGSYLPYNFIVDNWMDIHNSWDINIKKVDLSDCKSSACYVVSQYVGGQGSAYVRGSSSRKWVYSGYVSDWYYIRSWFDLSTAIDLFDEKLHRYANDYFYTQSSLSDYV